MGLCKDPRLTYLNESGYNVIRLPRTGLDPLGVIGREQDKKTWLGELPQIWHSDAPVPVPAAPSTVAALTGTRTSDIKLSLGLDILANALSGMFGATAPGVDVAYRNARSVQFVFRDVRARRVDPFVIGNYLARGDLLPNPFVKRFFTGQKNIEALVVSEVLEARSIGVAAKKDTTTEVAVDVPQLQALLGAKVSVSPSIGSTSEVTFEGPEYLVFGYKAFGIAMINGEWQIYSVGETGGLAFAVGADPQPVVDTGELVDIDFTPAS